MLAGITELCSWVGKCTRVSTGQAVVKEKVRGKLDNFILTELGKIDKGGKDIDRLKHNTVEPQLSGHPLSVLFIWSRFFMNIIT